MAEKYTHQGTENDDLFEATNPYEAGRTYKIVIL
jgi:hypothetical protein